MDRAAFYMRATGSQGAQHGPRAGARHGLAPGVRPIRPFPWSQARGPLLYNSGQATTLMQGTKHGLGVLLEPVWGLATQPNSPIVSSGVFGLQPQLTTATPGKAVIWLDISF